MTPWQDTKYAGDLKPDTAVVTLEYHDRLHAKIARLSRERDQLREALAELRAAQEAIAEHPENDSTNRLDDLLMRLEFAELEADEALANTEKETG